MVINIRQEMIIIQANLIQFNYYIEGQGYYLLDFYYE